MIRRTAALLSLTLLMISSSAMAHRPRLGEWESSGAPEPIYVPRGPVEYSCTIEVVLNQGAKTFIGRVYHDFHTADFAVLSDAIRNFARASATAYDIRTPSGNGTRTSVHTAVAIHP